MEKAIKVKTWKEAKEKFQELLDEGLWIFRGQANNNGLLQSSIERWINRNQHKDILSADFAEHEMLDLFKKGAHYYLNFSHLPKTTLEWLALMQHHGVPTRLLDFTRSPYVASFFAMDEAFPSNNGNDFSIVWAIHTLRCKKQAVKILNKQHNDKSKYPCSLSELDDTPILKNFEYIFLENPKSPKIIYPVYPEKENERLTIQQGLFICPGAPNNFEQCLRFGNSNQYDDHIMRIFIPNTCRREAIEDLQFMNISHATLFPGLDGFARSLQNKIYVKKLEKII